MSTRPYEVDAFIRGLTIEDQGAFDAFVDFMNTLAPETQLVMTKYMMARGLRSVGPQWVVFALMTEVLERLRQAMINVDEPILHATAALESRLSGMTAAVTSLELQARGLRESTAAAASLVSTTSSLIRTAAKQQIADQAQSYADALAALRAEDAKGLDKASRATTKASRLYALAMTIMFLIAFGAGIFFGGQIGASRERGRQAVDIVKREVLGNMLREAQRDRQATTVRYIEERLQ